jgi:L,D-transpeptidase YcbB
VYLHDTPADSLFARATRSFSHGCVRVEQPEALAEYVLRDEPEWTRDRIEAAMHAGEQTTVKLKTPLPVYLGYWTARVTPDGIVQFRKDLYGIDQRQTERLRSVQAERRSRASSINACSVDVRSSGSQGFGRMASQPARSARPGSCVNGA